MPAMTDPTHLPIHAHEGVHLVILHHGLWGNADHVKFLARQFKKRFGDRILVYRATSNESAFTYDGVDICGERLVQEIHHVIQTIETGGDIRDLKGQKGKKKSSTPSFASQGNTSSAASSTFTRTNNNSAVSIQIEDPSSHTRQHDNLPPAQKKVTQFSYLGYSLGGLIGRFAMGLLDLEGFFDPVEEGGRGIEPVYFVTMATPHLGIRQPTKSTFSKFFNYLSSRMLSRTGEQMQLVDDYVDGKPILLVMTEPEGVFVKALARFKRRALYCNIRNDRSVPYWTSSFSDADPFIELEALEIQYSSGYSSVIESFEHYDVETMERIRKEKEEAFKSAPFSTKAAQTLGEIPWKKYALFGLLGPVLIPVWIVFASSTISIQGLNSRRRTKDMVEASEDLLRIRRKSSTTSLSLQDSTDTDSVKSTSAESNELDQHTTVIVVSEAEEQTTSYSFPHIKTLKPLGLLPVQVEMSRNLNQLEWRKNIVHIEGLNAHASIVVREGRFSNHGGIAAVQHAVDMFKGDGEDV